MNNKDVRNILTIAAGVSVVTTGMSIGHFLMPRSYGLIRRLLYSYGITCLSMYFGRKSSEEVMRVYDIISKKYNANNEAETVNDKEVNNEEVDGLQN